MLQKMSHLLHLILKRMLHKMLQLKSLENRVPNCFIETKETPSICRTCRIPPVKKCSARVETLGDKSFQVQGPKLINWIQAKVINMKKCP